MSDEPTLKIRIKAVPGASRDAIAGMLGDRVKVRVSAPPEGGKANKAIIKLFARTLGCKPAQVSITSGHTNPEKSIMVEGCCVSDACDLLGFDLASAILNNDR